MYWSSRTELSETIARLLFFRTKEVEIEDCVHYCGFRYGRNEFNPYEQYIRGLSQGVSSKILRDEFLSFILHFRPRNLAEALSISLKHPPSLWQLPWRHQTKNPVGWCDNPHSIPDILTHFSDLGVPDVVVRQEYRWLESAWANIKDNGYHPETYSYIRVFELRGESRNAYIVADGNHRISSLSIMGATRVVVQFSPFRTVSRSQVSQWPAVRSHGLSVEDALRIFDAYFDGNQQPHYCSQSADILRND